MPSCLIIGDSIALGLASALAFMNSGDCDVRARVGASSRTVASLLEAREYEVAIISAGSNDTANRDLISDLQRLRQRMRARRVTWIYPRAVTPAWAVHDVASRFNDRTVSMQKLISRDGVHPANYQALIPLIFGPVHNRQRSSLATAASSRRS